MKRRQFCSLASQVGTLAYVIPRARDAFGTELTDDARLPNITSGVASGDVSTNSAILWSRCDRPSRMVVDVASNEAFRNAKRLVGPEVLESSDFTGKMRLTGLKSGEEFFYRVQFQDLSDLARWSAPCSGRFQTASEQPRDISFAWSGDTAGQGYGIDLARGGMKTFEAIRKLAPQFFVNSGDVCYADNPVSSEIRLDDGTIWKNVITEGKSKVAETLEEFRANYRYNLLDDNVRRMNAEIPSFVQWDDHEVLNNWYPNERLDDPRYREKSVALLAARAKQAFFEYLPIRSSPDSHLKVFRRMPYGPLLELFFLDLRSYRGDNSANRQTERSEATSFLGNQQLRWLKRCLSDSQATWKIICCDMPIGLIVRDGKDSFENGANGNGLPLGRELEFMELFRYIKNQGIKNTVWITADVHYAASYYYDPNKAVFQDFEPFWEFVSGPLHAGTFGPAELDNTFGPQLVYKSIPDGMRPNRPPSEGLQFFGMIKIDSKSKALTVSHRNSEGTKLWEKDLESAV
jgi:alkaline phosphatase D